MYHLGTHAGFIRGSYATHTALLKRYNYPVILFVFRVDFLQHTSSSSRAPLTIVPNCCKKHIQNGKKTAYLLFLLSKNAPNLLAMLSKVYWNWLAGLSKKDNK